MNRNGPATNKSQLVGCLLSDVPGIVYLTCVIILHLKDPLLIIMALAPPMKYRLHSAQQQIIRNKIKFSQRLPVNAFAITEECSLLPRNCKCQKVEIAGYFTPKELCLLSRVLCHTIA